MSLPAWECGLKLSLCIGNIFLYAVTPRVGVWIETICGNNTLFICIVTPRVGVWIETVLLISPSFGLGSLPAWECGLKRKSPFSML